MRRSDLTPGVLRWLRQIDEQGHGATRPRGSVPYRARREQLTDWWLRDRETGAELLACDVPREHIPYGNRYEITGEALTPAGRAALAASESDGGVT